MIMKILSTIVLLLTAVTLSAQPDAATCTGQTCTGQGSAIGFATVSFFSETDSSAVYGALADSTADSPCGSRTETTGWRSLCSVTRKKRR